MGTPARRRSLFSQPRATLNFVSFRFDAPDHRASRFLPSASIVGTAKNVGLVAGSIAASIESRCGAEVDGEGDIDVPGVEYHHQAATWMRCAFVGKRIEVQEWQSSPQRLGLAWSTFIEESHVFLIVRPSGGSDFQTRPVLALSGLSKDNPGVAPGKNSRKKS